MKTAKRLFTVLGALALVLSLAACEKESGPESTALPESSAVSTAPTPQPEPESSWFIPADDLIPDGVEEGTEGFEGLFSQNPIDKKYDADYARAMSFSPMLQACDEATASWEKMMDTAFQAALDTLSGQERDSLQEDQDIWERNAAQQTETAESEAGSDNTAILTAAKEKVLLYRERAKELCQIVYEASGAMPEFE